MAKKNITKKKAAKKVSKKVAKKTTKKTAKKASKKASKKQTTKKAVKKKLLKKKVAPKKAKQKTTKKKATKKTARKKIARKATKKSVRKKTAKKTIKKKAAKKTTTKKNTKKALKKNTRKKAATKKAVKKITKKVAAKKVTTKKPAKKKKLAKKSVAKKSAASIKKQALDPKQIFAQSPIVENDSSQIRVLVGKAGLDGHDRGAKIIARACRDAGFEVVYTGLHQTPEMIVNTAIQEDVHVLGLSILSGAHNFLVPEIAKKLKAEGIILGKDILLVIGGIIPETDFASLKEQGVSMVFTPGASVDTIVEYIRKHVKVKE